MEDRYAQDTHAPEYTSETHTQKKQEDKEIQIKLTVSVNACFWSFMTTHL